MIYKINGKTFEKSSFIANMIKDLSKTDQFLMDQLSMFVDNLDGLSVNDLTIKEIEYFTELYVKTHLEEMLDFIHINKENQWFNDKHYTIIREDQQ